MKAEIRKPAYGLPKHIDSLEGTGRDSLCRQVDSLSEELDSRKSDTSTGKPSPSLPSLPSPPQPSPSPHLITPKSHDLSPKPTTKRTIRTQNNTQKRYNKKRGNPIKKNKSMMPPSHTPAHFHPL